MPYLIVSIAYFVVEVLPDLRNDRTVRTARAKAVAALGPARQVRAARDPRTQGKLAGALYETGQGVEALALLDAVDLPQGQSERDKQQLLRGKILEHLGRKDEALGLYEDVVTRIPGEEARCRYAALLLDQGWDRKAIEVLEEVESRMKRLDWIQRMADAGMYRWASDTLA